jgi:primosomal protein N' (replication factor Y)
MYAEVIIPLALPKNYTWSVPEHFRSHVKAGIRVEVVLGKNKKYSGIIKSLIEQQPQAYDTKDILNVLDSEPVVFPEQLALWEWIASYYMCSEGEVMAAALPAHFKLSSETVLVFNEEHGDDFSDLDHDEFLVAEALLVKKELTISEVQQVLDNPHAYPVIRKLIEKKVCFVWESLKETYSAKKEQYIILHPQYASEDKLADLLNNWSRAPKQMEVLLAYLHLQKTQGEVTKSELLKKSGASDAQLKSLAEKQVVIIESRRVDRVKYLPKTVNIDFQLSNAQQIALDNLRSQLKDHSVCLLHGVTSSGKTQVYIKLIEEIIQAGNQVLYLLPEIALTSQIIRRLEKHFGGYIGIYHSKFTQNERIEIWNKIKKGELKVVLGARSALYLPFSDLALIIVDEEHDTSYKQQDPAPRYHARDTAIYYAAQVNAKVVLGSATPSVESYFNAVNKKYGLVELDERFGGIALPQMEVIDTRKESPFSSEKVIVTPSLRIAIEHTLQQKKQVILFQNRRGYSPYQVCQVCGWIPHCRNCDVTLTFHKKTHKLHCHYCGQLYPQVHVCQACGSDKFARKNFGTEKIEEQLEEMFPEARVARMDVDSVRGKNAHDNLIRNFEQGKIDLLVGTQMVVKGLDFENVQLVGVLDADSLLNFADFRVNERAFQLIEQVSGRAGRKDSQGKVAIQAINTRHPLLQLLREHDYKAFYEAEADGRKRFFYPPFSRIILLTFKHKMKDVVDGAIEFFTQAMRPRYGQYLVGPAEPIVNRIRNQFIMELLVKLPKDAVLVKTCKQFILDQVAVMHGITKFKSVVVIPDVDH